jgi:hypothetical protein
VEGRSEPTRVRAGMQGRRRSTPRSSKGTRKRMDPAGAGTGRARPACAPDRANGIRGFEASKGVCLGSDCSSGEAGLEAKRRKTSCPLPNVGRHLREKGGDTAGRSSSCCRGVAPGRRDAKGRPGSEETGGISTQVDGRRTETAMARKKKTETGLGGAEKGGNRDGVVWASAHGFWECCFPTAGRPTTSKKRGQENGKTTIGGRRAGIGQWEGGEWNCTRRARERTGSWEDWEGDWQGLQLGEQGIAIGTTRDCKGLKCVVVAGTKDCKWDSKELQWIEMCCYCLNKGLQLREQEMAMN